MGGHGSRRRRKIGVCGHVDTERFAGHETLLVIVRKEVRTALGIIVETTWVGACHAVLVKRGGGRRGVVKDVSVEIALGKVTGKVSYKRVERTRPKELDGERPLLRPNELRVGDDLYTGQLERVVELTKTLNASLGHAAMELVLGAGVAGDLENIVVEGFRVLNGRRKGVVLVMQLGEEVSPLHAKLPGGPGVAWVVHCV